MLFPLLSLLPSFSLTCSPLRIREGNNSEVTFVLTTQACRSVLLEQKLTTTASAKLGVYTFCIHGVIHHLLVDSYLKWESNQSLLKSISIKRSDRLGPIFWPGLGLKPVLQFCLVHGGKDGKVKLQYILH